MLAEEVGRAVMEMLRSYPARFPHSRPRSLLSVVPLPLIQSLSFQHILGWAQAKQGGKEYCVVSTSDVPITWFWVVFCLFVCFELSVSFS